MFLQGRKRICFSLNRYPDNKAGQQHSGGCHVVTAYSYFTADAADAETADDGDAIDGSVELAMILDSMSFAKESN